MHVCMYVCTYACMYYGKCDKSGYCAQFPVIMVNVIKLTKFITFPGKCVESPTTL